MDVEQKRQHVTKENAALCWRVPRVATANATAFHPPPPPSPNRPPVAPRVALRCMGAGSFLMFISFFSQRLRANGHTRLHSQRTCRNGGRCLRIDHRIFGVVSTVPEALTQPTPRALQSMRNLHSNHNSLHRHRHSTATATATATTTASEYSTELDPGNQRIRSLARSSSGMLRSPRLES